MSERGDMTRRRFIKTAAGAAGVFAGLPALSLGRKFSQNDKIQMGVIGCGGMGTGHVQNLTNLSKDGTSGVELVAVCDVYEARKERAKQISGGQVYHEYEELIARPDIDAVLIATPDHWHAKISMDAMHAGKDVYCEKPMTRTWQEAKQVWETVKKTGKVLQVGAQSCSEDRWWRANNWISTGQIGKLLWTKSSYSRNSREGEWNWGIDKDAGPNNIDWKRWLGSAPKRPFDPDRYFRFRKYWDYSGGIATDLFYHQLSHLLIAVGPEFPTYVSSHGGIYVQKDREVPDTFHMMIEMPAQHTIVLCSSMANRTGVDEGIHGHEANIRFEGDGFTVSPEEEFKNERPQIHVGSRERSDHMHNFLECCRSRQKPNCDADLAFKTMVAIALGVESYRKRRMMMWDAEKMKAVER